MKDALHGGIDPMMVIERWALSYHLGAALISLLEADLGDYRKSLCRAAWFIRRFRECVGNEHWKGGLCRPPLPSRVVEAWGFDAPRRRAVLLLWLGQERRSRRILRIIELELLRTARQMASGLYRAGSLTEV